MRAAASALMEISALTDACREMPRPGCLYAPWLRRAIPCFWIFVSGSWPRTLRPELEAFRSARPEGHSGSRPLGPCKPAGDHASVGCGSLGMLWLFAEVASRSTRRWSMNVTRIRFHRWCRWNPRRHDGLHNPMPLMHRQRRIGRETSRNHPAQGHVDVLVHDKKKPNRARTTASDAGPGAAPWSQGLWCDTALSAQGAHPAACALVDLLHLLAMTLEATSIRVLCSRRS